MGNPSAVDQSTCMHTCTCILSPLLKYKCPELVISTLYITGKIDHSLVVVTSVSVHTCMIMALEWTQGGSEHVILQQSWSKDIDTVVKIFKPCNAPIYNIFFNHSAIFGIVFKYYYISSSSPEPQGQFHPN